MGLRGLIQLARQRHGADSRLEQDLTALQMKGQTIRDLDEVSAEVLDLLGDRQVVVQSNSPGAMQQISGANAPILNISGGTHFHGHDPPDPPQPGS